MLQALPCGLKVFPCPKLNRDNSCSGCVLAAFAAPTCTSSKANLRPCTRGLSPGIRLLEKWSRETDFHPALVSAFPGSAELTGRVHSAAVEWRICATTRPLPD